MLYEFYRLNFLFKFYIHGKTEQKYRDFPYTPCPPPPKTYNLLQYQHPVPEMYICYNWWTYTDTS